MTRSANLKMVDSIFSGSILTSACIMCGFVDMLSTDGAYQQCYFGELFKPVPVKNWDTFSANDSDSGDLDAEFHQQKIHQEDSKKEDHLIPEHFGYSFILKAQGNELSYYN